MLENGRWQKRRDSCRMWKKNDWWWQGADFYHHVTHRIIKRLIITFFWCHIETDGWKNAKPRYITELFWTSQGCSHCRVLRPFRLNSTLWHTTQQEPPTYVFWFVPKYDISHSLIFRNQTHIIVLNAQGTFEGTFGKKHKWLNGGFVWFTGDWGTTNAFRWKCD